MDTGDIILLIACLVGGAIVIGVVIYYLKVDRPKALEKERIRRQEIEEEYEKEPEYEFLQARVSSKRHTTFYPMGGKAAALHGQQHERFIRFLKEDGTEAEYPVRQEIFDRIEEGQEGTLVTVNGNFFDFGDGEELPSEEPPTETAEE